MRKHESRHQVHKTSLSGFFKFTPSLSHFMNDYYIASNSAFSALLHEIFHISFPISVMKSPTAQTDWLLAAASCDTPTVLGCNVIVIKRACQTLSRKPFSTNCCFLITFCCHLSKWRQRHPSANESLWTKSGYFSYRPTSQLPTQPHARTCSPQGLITTAHGSTYCHSSEPFCQGWFGPLLDWFLNHPCLRFMRHCPNPDTVRHETSQSNVPI